MSTLYATVQHVSGNPSSSATAWRVRWIDATGAHQKTITNRPEWPTHPITRAALAAIPGAVSATEDESTAAGVVRVEVESFPSCPVCGEPDVEDDGAHAANTGHWPHPHA